MKRLLPLLLSAVLLVSMLCVGTVGMALRADAAAVVSTGRGGDAPAVSADSVTALAGQTVQVALRVQNNPGIVALRANVSYDSSVLILTNIEGADFADAAFSPLESNPITVNWVDSIHPDVTEDGVLALLTFTVAEGARAGSYPLTVSIPDPDDVFNYEMETVAMDAVSGGVSVVTYTPGDINGDTKVNIRDLGLFQQYLNGWDVTIIEAAADVNGDNKLNIRDLGTLQQFLNGWNVELKYGGADMNTGTDDAYVVPEGGFNMNEPVEITFAHTMGRNLQDILNKHIAEFNKIYPNITIKHSSYGGWYDLREEISYEIADGNPPNLAYCYPDYVADYNAADATVVLDNLITHNTLGLTEEQQNDFVDSLYASGKVHGDDRMYSLPLSRSTEVLYYNKTFFDEHNLTVPTTWEEMWEVCAQIKAIDKNCTPLGYDSENNWFITLCEQMGSGYISAENGGEYLFNNDQNKAAMKELREYYKKGYFTTQQLYGGYTSGLFTEQGCYMSIGSTGGALYNSFWDDKTEVGIAPIPQYNTNQPKAISQGPSLCILKGKNTTDQQVLASWLFMKFLCTNADFQAEFSMMVGYMPAIHSALEHPSFVEWLNTADGYNNLSAYAAQVSIDNLDSYYTSPAFVGSSVARDEVGDLLVRCLAYGETDDIIDRLFEEAIAACEAARKN